MSNGQDNEARMRETDDALSGDDAIAALLPFYVTGTLDTIDRDRVETWVERTPNGREALERAREEQMLVMDANTALRPASGALGRLMQAIKDEPQPKRPLGLIGDLLRDVDELWQRLPVRAAWGAVAALLLVAVLQSAYLVSGDGDAGYELAGGQPAATIRASAIIRFQPGADVASVSKLLTETGTRVIDGPRANGLYVIGFAEAPTLPPVAERLKQLADARELVAFVSEKKE